MSSEKMQPCWSSFLTRISLSLIAGAIFVSSAASAKVFRNAYVQFDLPEQWDCTMEGTEWVCASRNKIDSKESIIILTAKEAGPQDTFPQYIEHLKTKKPVQLLNGKKVLSEVKNVQTRKINDQQWVDSLHLGSEIPGYYTRYLATVKDKLAILVTLSAHQKFYTKYSTDFFRAVESLRVVASKDVVTPKALAPLSATGDKQVLGQQNKAPLPQIDVTEPPPPEESSGSKDNMLLGLVVLLVALGGYFYLKKNRS